jgi:predicted MPP superfamily phosphohydrolase
LKQLSGLIGAAAVSALAGLAYAALIEPNWFDLTDVGVGLSGLTPAFDGYRIVQFSDVHMNGSSMTRERLQTIVALINARQPDLIVFTGDFVTERAHCLEDDLVEPLSALSAPDGKLAIMGNHDYRGHDDMIRRVMSASGFVHLNNRVHTLVRGATRLHIAGVDSVLRRRARLDQALAQLPEDGAAILLAHEPDFAYISSATGRFGLQLSGHSHGGQIRVPVLTRYVLPHYSQRYVRGAYMVGNMLLYVNRGVGTVGLPLRFNSRPEITLFTLFAPPTE